MKTKWFWMMCMIVMTSLVTVSCGDDDDESGAGNAPEGTITVNLTKSPSHIVDFGGNFGGMMWLSSNNFYTNNEVLSLGEKNGLGSININKIPESGWTDETACKPGYAYIVRRGGADGVYYYTGIYLVRNIISTSGGIMGVEIQYCNFTPGKGWNQ